VGMMNDLKMPDVTPALKQTIVDGVTTEAKGRSVEQLAAAENDVLLGLLALRAKAGSTLP
jgi:carnitine 3-dehydrogenase